MINKKTLGRRGEEIACRALEGDGYRVIEKNFRCRYGEIDIVAEEKGVICFVEVKSRSSESFGFPEEAVTVWKQRKLYASAAIYLEKRKISPQGMRFDVVSVDLNSEKVRILKNAFEVNL